MLLRLALFTAPSVGLAFAESYMINNFSSHDTLGLTEATTITVPSAYGLVVCCNLVASSVVLTKLAFKVGAARKEYGVEYPHMYASGDDEKSRMFNCIQRGHQQALESYTTFVGCSLIAGIRHPFVTAGLGIVYCIARLKWAQGYASGVPDNRYAASKWGIHIWSTYLGVIALSVSTACGILGLF
mmetsp:Transcript_5825/g.6709  ORF Transcript_5825/g.6709 Transcript_5825/m.6709 type:complete len:185 (+) Transcript_5825:204-758(+)|eukprot:CAMPEP_0184021318 /NCGR_PEP_ID=MMETSP0954-20121128/9861_1 /TAXON_ID=627963 /ORGANISM="Aplanochytrium sp, Strain PBS07" /LENGTH=184 /DNA_ID=CAMNT_0026303323 /DNA_START=243 /DNA_END=797 /DNA_ORIENTATION=+